MTIDEKLTHFYDASVEEARSEAAAMLEAHRHSLDEMTEEHKKLSLQNAEAQVRAETENAKREVNKALSAQQLMIKRDWTQKQTELKDKLFVEVKRLLEEFTATPAYEDYLCKKIEEAKKFAGKDEIFIYISPEDTSLLHELSVRTGFAVQISEESFIGGIRSMIPSKNILIDNSFSGNFESMRKQFKFDGGFKHE